MSKTGQEQIREAQVLLQQAEEARVNECKEELDKILRKYQCTIEASVMVTQRGNFPQVSIVSLPPNQQNLGEVDLAANGLEVVESPDEE